VDNGDFSGTTFRSNYPKFAKDMLKMSSYKNYARSGASFFEYSGQLTWQKISHQVQTAITNAESPDIIVLACGTNDGTTNLGDYATAMGKSIDALDKSNTAEAMRWALYQIRKNFPNATCFYSTQLQRADVETEDRKVANDLMVKLAKRYGFNVIDTMYNSGIVRDFEVWNSNGRYLYDGLHPNVAGQQIQANYIVSQIITVMTY
jgi:lysophospholipase L1-like esterase